MKILWFTNSPCGSIRRFSQSAQTGGWMISLEDELKKNTSIKLSVAYISSKPENSFRYDGVDYYPICRCISRNGIKRIISRLESFQKKDTEILSKLLSVVNEVQPDLIHIHGTEECFGIIQDAIKNIPIVFSIQGLMAPYTEKFFSGISFSDAKKYESVTDKIKQVSIVNNFNYFSYRSVRERNYLCNAKYIMGRTFWDKNCTLALNPKRKYYVVNEILRPVFYEKQWKGFFSMHKISLVSIITAGIYKGMETLLKTAAILKEYSNLSFEWHIVGYSHNEKWVKISEEVTGLKSAYCNIIYHGKLDAEHVSDLLCRSDMYVHVSHIENSPNSVCEAMCLGMPVIATYAGGTCSLLEHEVDGILCQDGDPYVLAGSIIDYIKRPDIAYAYAKSARNRAIIRHDRKNVVKELLTTYHDVINDYYVNK